MRATLLLIFFLISACAELPVQVRTGTSVKDITSAEAAALIREGRAVIDVRSPDERLTGEIQGAEHIMFGPIRWTERAASPSEIRIFLATVQKAHPDKAEPLVIVCNIGVRSSAAAQVLAQAGYEQVKPVRQGFIGNRFGIGLEAELLSTH